MILRGLGDDVGVRSHGLVVGGKGGGCTVVGVGLLLATLARTNLLSGNGDNGKSWNDGKAKGGKTGSVFWIGNRDRSGV